MFGDQIDCRRRGDKVVFRIWNTEMKVYRTGELTEAEMVLVMLGEKLAEMVSLFREDEEESRATAALLQFQGTGYNGYMTGHLEVTSPRWRQEVGNLTDEEKTVHQTTTVVQARGKAESHLAALTLLLRRACMRAGVDTSSIFAPKPIR